MHPHSFNPFLCTGVIVRLDSTENLLGSCFSLSSPKWFISAAHCVGVLQPGELKVALPRFDEDCHLQVQRIFRHPEADICVLEVDWDGDSQFRPFSQLGRRLDWGEEILAFGFPEDSVADEGPGPTPRLFRGYVQRVFTHASPLKFSYTAAELSFGSPAGLSGGPVSVADGMQWVSGVVTENFESSTFLHAVEQVQIDGSLYREKIHSVVNYGVCVVLHDVYDWLTSIIGTERPAA